MSRPAKQTNNVFERETGYLLYLPEGYERYEAKRWPLIIFLHGAGERGNDLELVKLHGPPKLIEAGRDFKFIIASPQLPSGERWSPDIVAWLTRALVSSLRIDPDRIYLTGLSMGGYGTWETAVKYPELYAAIAPICGRGDPAQAWRLRHMPTWIFHGAKDNVVPIKHSDDMRRALRRYRNVKYTVYPEAGHDSWSETYLSQRLYSWMLRHKRFTYPDALASSQLERYVGHYKSKENSAVIALKNGGLCISLATSAEKEISLIPCGVDSFTFNDFSTFEVVFIPDRKKGYRAVDVYERRMFHLKKV